MRIGEENKERKNNKKDRNHKLQNIMGRPLYFESRPLCFAFIVFEERKMQNKYNSSLIIAEEIILGSQLGSRRKRRCCLFMEGLQPRTYFFSCKHACGTPVW